MTAADNSKIRCEIHARLVPNDYERLKEISVECDTILSEVIRAAIAFYLQVYDMESARKDKMKLHWMEGDVSQRFDDFEECEIKSSDVYFFDDDDDVVLGW